MKGHLLRLQSSIINGFGGPDVGSINLMYSVLLEEYGLDYYSQIDIHQIGDDLNEFIEIKGKKVWININYEGIEDFENRSFVEKNKVRLNLIDKAMNQLAEKDKRTDKQLIDNIKKKIESLNYYFDITYKYWPFENQNNLISKLIIQPLEKSFDFYLVIVNNKNVICNKLIYSGITNDFYIDLLFRKGKWKNSNEFVLTGLQKEVQIILEINTCQVFIEYLTSYNNDNSIFEMMKAK